MFLSIRSIPKVSWSSNNPLNYKPKISTFLFLCIGLSLFGLGEGLIMISYIGNSPWQVLAQGIALHANFSIGFITFLISISVLSLWIFLGQKPGMGTFLNAIIIAAMIDLSIAFIPTPELYISKFLMLVCGVLLVGFGSGLYLIANLGPGPRDGLMTGLQRKTNLPIAVVRAFIEITVATVGWYLGGTLGEGTLLFAFGIGPAVALGLFLVSRFYAKN
ncbi:membrane protein YczE [Candidatus Pelagibacter sp. IMCC9063]|uniref:membrane protein YczE n=1 Tax=Pelagibacter sp. (strain IMCC9063) TaxID=1002672 RepID=UPI0005A449DB